MKILDNIIKGNIIYIIVLILILIALTVFITAKVFNNTINTIYAVDDFIVNSDRRIKARLNKVSDADSKKEFKYTINVTNNGQPKRYKVLLSPIVDEDYDIRLSINDNIIRNLSSFEKEDNAYVIHTNYLQSSYSDLNYIRMWQKTDSQLHNIRANFKIEVKVG